MMRCEGQDAPRLGARSSNDVDRINAEHLIETPLKLADLLFVFGTRSGVEARVDAAATVWREGLCRWLVVSGGLTAGGDRTECATIKDALVSSGLPASVILEEDRATNTGENVVFSLPILDARLGLTTIRSVICLGHFWTGRRYAMTLHRHWPGVEKMLLGVNYYATPKELWHTDPQLCARVNGEWNKIEPYKAKGFIAAWP